MKKILALLGAAVLPLTPALADTPAKPAEVKRPAGGEKISVKPPEMKAQPTEASSATESKEGEDAAAKKKPGKKGKK